MAKIHKNCAKFARTSRISCLFAGIFVSLPACQTGAGDAAAVADEDTQAVLCGDDGRISGDFYGEIRATLDWGPREVACEGMPRPDGRGARMRFAGQLDDGGPQLAIIIAMPEFTRETVSGELSANVTIIEEGAGRFFSTTDLDNCISDVQSVVAADESSNRFSVSGALYCVSPLPEMNGDSSVSIAELEFSGLVDWGAS